MKFIIDKKVFEKFPDLVVAVPIIMGFDNSRSQKEALSFLREKEAELRRNMTLDLLWKDKRVTAYLDCFRAFGTDPKKFVPAHVALAARVLEGKDLPDINPMVNLYNAMSIKYLTPFGGENLDSLFGDFILRFAAGGEQWIPIGGGKSKPATAGELVLGDDFDLSTRALNWRQCDRTKMTGETTAGYFIMDGFSGVNRDNIQKAADDFIQTAVEMFGGKAEIYWLSREHPVAEIPFTPKRLPEVGQAGQKKDVSRKPKPKAVKEPPVLFEIVDWEGQRTLANLLRRIVFQAARKTMGSTTELDFDSVKMEHPANENYGDYSTNLALVLAGKLKMKPVELAKQLANELNEYIKQHQSITYLPDSLSHQDGKKSSQTAKIDPKTVDEILETASVAGPGFVNLTIRKDYLITLLDRVLNMDKGVVTTQLADKKIAVEYTDPNPFKEFHLGHMYSNFIGEAVSRMFEACGAAVWRGDFYGDVGMHVAKSVWGMLKILKEQGKTLRELNSWPVEARQKFLGQGYAHGVREFEADKSVQEEVKDINYLIYVVGQELLAKNRKWTPIVNYSQYIQGKEKNIKEIAEVYEAGLKWSLAYFESIYKILDTKFDGYYPESWVGEYGMKIVEKGLKMGVLEKDDGAVVYRGEKDGLHTRVFVNKLGLPTYEAKDLGLAFAKYQDFRYDLSINIFGKEIDEYYYVVKSALRKIEPELGKKAYHLAHGMVKLPEGKMSSRTGNVITFEGLLGKLKEEVKKIMKDSDMEGEGREDVARAVGLGAVRYALLKSNIGVDVVFDFDKSISFDGDSGPYLMYTYARCRSVLRKAQDTLDIKAGDASGVTRGRTRKLELNPEELSLLHTLYRFPEVVAEAAHTLTPGLICTYLFGLAQKFNLFYNKHSILSPSMQQLNKVINFRLALTQATAVVLKRGLYILGIETVERM